MQLRIVTHTYWDNQSIGQGFLWQNPQMSNMRGTLQILHTCEFIHYGMINGMVLWLF